MVLHAPLFSVRLVPFVVLLENEKSILYQISDIKIASSMFNFSRMSHPFAEPAMNVRHWLNDVAFRLNQIRFQTKHPGRVRLHQNSVIIETLETRQLLSGMPLAAAVASRVAVAPTGSIMESSDVASDAAGDYVVVWQTGSNPQTQPSSPQSTIHAHRFNSAGVSQGSDITVATSSGTTSSVSTPSVAMDSKGDFVVTWLRFTSNATSQSAVTEARRYNAAGVSQGTAFKVNTGTQDSLNPFGSGPSVAMDAQGDFVIAYSAGINSATFATQMDLRRFNLSGVPQGNPIPVTLNPTDPFFGTLPIAMNGSGNFVIAGSTTSGLAVQRYNAAGVAQGSAITVASSSTTVFSSSPAVAIDSAGDFVVSWISDTFVNNNSAGSNNIVLGVEARRFNSAGIAQGSAITASVSSPSAGSTTGFVSDPRVAVDSTGDFVVGWDVGNGMMSGKTFVKGYSAGGIVQGGQVTVDSKLIFQDALAMSSTGNFVVVGGGDPRGTPNQFEYGLYAQRFKLTTPPINHAPSGTSKTVTILEDQAYVIVPSDFGFTDAGNPAPNALLTVKISTLPTKGKLTDNGAAVALNTKIPVADLLSGKLKFTPAANKSGAPYDNLSFIVQDDGGTAGGGKDTDTTARKLTFNVTAVNDAPTGTPKTVTTLEDQAYTIHLADFGFSDSLDSPASSFLAVKITTVPSAGSLTDNGIAVTAGAHIPFADLNGAKLKFIPAANKNGAPYASFTFQVQDNGGTANGGVDTDPTPKKLSINVTTVNDAPLGAPHTVSMAKNSSYTFKVSDFGMTDANDSPANSLLAVNIVARPALGTLTDNGVAVTVGQRVTAVEIASGKLKFTPATNGIGTKYASFTFRDQDNGGTANGGADTDLIARTMTINVS